MSGREERIARNETVSREINEGLERGQEGRDRDRYVRMVCECGNEHCDRIVAITVPEYEDIRGDPKRFVVAKDHVEPEVERVVEEIARYTVVEKRAGPAMKIAEREDPRG